MAPEVYRKEGDYTEKVDIFSLSIIMAHLTTGMMAYLDQNMTVMVKKVAFEVGFSFCALFSHIKQALSLPYYCDDIIFPMEFGQQKYTMVSRNIPRHGAAGGGKA